MRVPLRAFVDPATQQVDLLVGQRVPGIGRRHVLVRIRVRDALHEHALGRVARDDDATLREGAVLGVEMKLGFALLLVGP